MMKRLFRRRRWPAGSRDVAVAPPARTARPGCGSATARPGRRGRRDRRPGAVRVSPTPPGSIRAASGAPARTWWPTAPRSRPRPPGHAVASPHPWDAPSTPRLPRPGRDTPRRSCRVLTPGPATRTSGTISNGRSEEAGDVAVGVEVDVLGIGVAREAGHGAHVAADGVDVAGAGRGPDLAYRHPPAGRGSAELRVGADREVGLGDHDRQPTEAEPLEVGQSLGGRR